MAKSVKPLSAEEKLLLRNKAKREPERLESVFDNNEIKQNTDKLKDDFSICKIVYKDS